jgi:hypothetical protein
MDALVGAIERGERLAEGTVALTFDDGYRDALEVVAPILARYGLPAILYLPTGYVGRGETQWVDRLYTMFAARAHHRLELDGPLPTCFDLRDPKIARLSSQPGTSSGSLADALSTSHFPTAGSARIRWRL